MALAITNGSDFSFDHLGQQFKNKIGKTINDQFGSKVINVDENSFSDFSSPGYDAQNSHLGQKEKIFGMMPQTAAFVLLGVEIFLGISVLALGGYMTRLPDFLFM